MTIDQEKLTSVISEKLQKEGTDVQDFLSAAELIIQALSSVKEDETPRGTVYSVRLLDEEEMKKITAYVKKKLQREFVLDNKVDESLISGIRIVCGDKEIDGSLKNRIDMMKKSLLK